MYLSSLCLASILASVASFSTHRLNSVGVPVSRIKQKSSRTDQGWNNDNFLDALSGGRAAVDSANQQYYRESASRSAMRDRRLQAMAGNDGFDSSGSAAIFGAKVPGMPDKPPKAPPIDEENPMGGQMFKKMMEKAKQGPNRPLGQNFSNAAPGQSPTFVSPPVPPAASVPYSSAQPTAMDPMVYYQQQLQAWQQQVTAFAQFSALNPEAAAKITMPPPPPPPPMFTNVATPAMTTPVATTAEPQFPEPPKPDLEGNPNEVNPLDYVPRGSGNKDAYEITNPADVYFAQLKRDSYVRNVARRNGDIETANKPFADVGVKALNNLLPKELIAQRREQLRANGGEFETSRDEMIIPYEQDEPEVDRTYTGIRYKDKLMEMKKQKAGSKQAGSVTPSLTTAATATFPETLVPQSAPTSSPALEPMTAVQAMSIVDSAKEVVAPSGARAPASAPAPTPVDTKSKDDKSNANFALEIPSTFDDAPVPAPSAEDSEETRRKIRTLMGLILKHRGGPGFGHGRLQGNEAEKLIESAKEVLTLLKTEAGIEEYSNEDEDFADVTSPSVSTSLVQGRVAEAIACADAALKMYKSMDVEAQKDLLIPVRDALASTIKIINQELKDTLAANMESAPKPVYATTMEFPDTYRVTKPDEVLEATTELKNLEKEEESSGIPSPGNGGNNLKLEKIYNSLKAVAGDEKYGLRAINPEEVTHIKEVLTDMRGILMDELENGIQSE